MKDRNLLKWQETIKPQKEIDIPPLTEDTQIICGMNIPEVNSIYREHVVIMVMRMEPNGYTNFIQEEVSHPKYRSFDERKQLINDWKKKIQDKYQPIKVQFLKILT